MILDSRFFEKCVHPREGLAQKDKQALVFIGNAIELCLVDARTFGGVIRFSIDNKGMRRATGSSSQPMRIRNPFRFAEMSAYRIMTQFQLIGLPEDVEAYIEPTPQMAKEGFLILSSSYREGNIEFTVIVTRKMEISPYFPVAELRFRGLQRGEQGKSVLEDFIQVTGELSFGDTPVETIEDTDNGDDIEKDELVGGDENTFLDDDSDDDDFLDDDELDNQSLEDEIPIEIVGQSEVITEIIEEEKPTKPKPKPKPKPKTSTAKKAGTK